MNAVRTIATNTAIILGTKKSLEGSKPLKIIYPPNELLMNFDQLVKSFDKEIKNRSRQNQELIQLRDWLLPMLMNGQVYKRIEGKND